MAMMTLKLPDGVDAKLSEIAKKTGNSKASIIRTAIIEHLARRGTDG